MIQAIIIINRFSFFFLILLVFSCKSKPSYEEFIINEDVTVNYLQEAYAAKKYSIEGVVQQYLHRIERIDNTGPELNAVIVTNPDAIDIAKHLDEELLSGKIRGPLHGIPVLLKDNISTKDSMATTAGSRALAGDFTGKDSELARQLREAGAVIIGKTNLSEWANFRGRNSTSGWSAVGGQTKNPYVLDRNPCGSSSGSAVAVSANFAPLAFGTETNGSIVCPSHANGIVGIKPTVGLVSRTGIIPISYSQDTAGPMAKNVEDAAIALSVITETDTLDAKTMQERNVSEDYTQYLNENGLEGKRIGYVQDLAKIDSVMDSLYQQALKKMEELGAELILIDQTFSEEAGNVSFDIMLMEYEDGLNEYFKNFSNNEIESLEDVISFNRKDSFEMEFYKQEYLEQALEQPNMDSEDYKAALTIIEEKGRVEFDQLFAEGQIDAIAVPTGTAAWKTNWETGDQFNFGSSTPAAVTGYPNISVPMGFDGELPIGISIFGQQWQEAKLIEMAYAYEQATNHRKEPKFMEK